MEEIIKEWGYLAVLLGSMVEGESVILTAGFLAHEGYLSLYKIIMISFAGSVFADQVLYYVGRYYGEPILNRYPTLRTRSDRAFRLLRRYGTIYILSFRFIYGIRTLSPIVIGVAGIRPLRYAVLNVIAAAIWAVLSCCAGYYLAHFLMDSLEIIPKILFGVIVGGGFVGYIIYRYKTWKRKPDLS